MSVFATHKFLFPRFYYYSHRLAIIGCERNSFYSRTFFCHLVRRNLRCYTTEKKWITIFFEKRNGIRLRRKGKVGEKLYDILKNDTDFPEYGVCEGTQACSTCHVIFTKEDFITISKYKHEKEEEENDLLDDIEKQFSSVDADFRTDFSRLGCCVKLVPEMDGMVITIPRTKSFMD